MKTIKTGSGSIKNVIKHSLVYGLILLSYQTIDAQNNLSLMGTALAGSQVAGNPAGLAIDGNMETAWVSESINSVNWLTVILPGATEIKEVRAHMESGNDGPVHSYAIQTYLNGTWRDQIKHLDNQQKDIVIAFEKAILTDRIRLAVEDEDQLKVREFEIFGEQYVDSTVKEVKKILVNQSGYNLDKPKRFTAPEVPDHTPFLIKNVLTQKTVYRGVVQKAIGDFTPFNPLSSEEFVVTIDTSTSYPFRIGPFWLERVTYRNMVDFMQGARHYIGTTNKIRRLSWAWRDGDFFNWALQSLIAQFLANPEAYMRMEKRVSYAPNGSFPPDYKAKWGSLEPYNENAPDIVKLIHWDVDVKISQQVEHEHQKAELAHFLYAFPFLKQWLPRQNFEIVYAYLKEKWTKPEVAKTSSSQYDKSPEHNLLSLKTKLGTSKGELPPGHSVIPNLMMYKVAKKQGEPDADKYFEAAYRQMEWMIGNLSWSDPMTTKGQRVSEHITMRAFAYFIDQYPKKAPIGLRKKVEEWTEVAIARSNNMWDFRKFTDSVDWVPAGWNETGNVLGFPACALAAMSVIESDELLKELDRLVWSHFDNVFGRNPTGRHFSYDGPSEIEGVDLGWYSAHHGGVGLLEPVRFVFDGSPKTNHYPNHPEIGNLGWTEGWVQFNTAFNISMAYLAHHDITITVGPADKNTLSIRLKAPLNFNEKKVDEIDIMVYSSGGDSVLVTLTQESEYSKYLSGNVPYKKRKIKRNDKVLQVKKGDIVTVSYGLGYFEKIATAKIKY